MKTINQIRIVSALALMLLSWASYGQVKTSNKFGKGLQMIAADSSFSLKFSTRFQTLYEGTKNLTTKSWADKMMIRRARLKFSGWVYNPNINFKVEMAVSNRDNGKISPETNNAANIILDAVLKLKVHKNLQLWIGQTKLPGNRERVISSQQLQFVDRSQLNSKYTIDRGIGIQSRYAGKLGKSVVLLQGAITMGDGRNLTVANVGGYEYTGRVELLPYGKFSSKGDYFGADLAREETPKLAIGATYDFNDDSFRPQGFKGSFMSESRDITTVFVDAMFKYSGLSIMAEYAKKSTNGSPEGVDGTFYTGTGLNASIGYLLKNNLEFAGRFTQIIPEAATGNEKFKEFTFGMSRYIVGHNLKIQSDLTYVDNEIGDDKFKFRLQTELAF